MSGHGAFCPIVSDRVLVNQDRRLFEMAQPGKPGKLRDLLRESELLITLWYSDVSFTQDKKKEPLGVPPSDPAKGRR